MISRANVRLLLSSTACAILVLVALVACTPVRVPQAGVVRPTNAAIAAPTAAVIPRGGNLTVLATTDIPSLRPWQPRSRAEEQTTALLYSGLVRLDTLLRPQPDLASTWRTSLDGRLITFTLRPDLYWHDGSRLTADDVGFTITALQSINPNTALLGDLRRIQQVTTPATDTVVIALTERYAPILAELTLPILPRHLLEGKNLEKLDFWQYPIGSGPFKFSDRKPGKSWILSSNERFHRGRPLLERVAFLVSGDPSVQIGALQDGHVLLAELPWTTHISATKTLSRFSVGSYPENGYYYLAVNTRLDRLLKDVRIRQALAATLDIPAIVKDATDGRGIPINSSAAPGSWADFIAPPESAVDLDLARQLLANAGYRLVDGEKYRQLDGVPLRLSLFVRGDDPRRILAADQIKASAEQVGIEIDVIRSDFESVIRSKYGPPYDFDLLLGSWSNGPGDPTFADYAYYDPDDLALFHSSQMNQGLSDTRAALNISGFDDTIYDNQSAAAQQLYETSDRAEPIRLAQQRVHEMRPYIFLWADQMPVLLNSSVTSLDGPIQLSNPMYLANIERWYIETPTP